MKVLRQLFGPSQKEIIDRAFLRAAVLDAEAAKQATLIELYTALLATIDHTTDWWSYAAARQAQHDAGVEYNAVQKSADHAREQCNAVIGVNPDVSL